MWQTEEAKKIKFRIAENITFGGESTYVPQIQEDDDWSDIDFDGEEYMSVFEGGGELKFKTLDEATKTIHDYVRLNEIKLRHQIKESIYHDITI